MDSAGQPNTQRLLLRLSANVRRSNRGARVALLIGRETLALPRRPMEPSQREWAGLRWRRGVYLVAATTQRHRQNWLKLAPAGRTVEWHGAVEGRGLPHALADYLVRCVTVWSCG